MKKALALSMLAAASVSGCANSYNDWNRVQTSNFNLYTNTDEHYKETLRQLENAYAGLSSSFFRDKQVGPVDVLFLDDSEFVDYFGNFRKGAALSSVPGDGPIGKKGLLVLRPHVFVPGQGNADSMGGFNPTAGSGAAGNFAAVAAKAMLTHVFIDRVMPRAPLWFHEGFASYVSTSELRSSGGRTFACFGYPQRTEALIPVAQLWDVGFHQYAQPELRGFLPATGYTMIDYIVHADNNSHRAMMGPLVNGLASGQRSEELVKAAFGGADTAAIDNLLGSHKQLITQQIESFGGRDTSNLDGVGRERMVEQQMASSTQVRGLCPWGFEVPANLQPQEAAAKVSPAPAAEVAALFRALDALPAKDEYPPYYPPAVLEKVKVAPAKK